MAQVLWTISKESLENFWRATVRHALNLRSIISAIAIVCGRELQALFARAMLAAGPVLSGVYYVDDHFVPYAGAKPVGKGGTTSAEGRRRAGPTRASPTTTGGRSASCPGSRRA